MSEQVMSRDAFRGWLDAMGFRYQDAADALGLSLDQVKSMALGRRDVSRTTALACSALYHRIDYSNDPWMLTRR